MLLFSRNSFTYQVNTNVADENGWNNLFVPGLNVIKAFLLVHVPKNYSKHYTFKKQL